MASIIKKYLSYSIENNQDSGLHDESDELIEIVTENLEIHQELVENSLENISILNGVGYLALQQENVSIESANGNKGFIKRIWDKVKEIFIEFCKSIKKMIVKMLEWFVELANKAINSLKEKEQEIPNNPPPSESKPILLLPPPKDMTSEDEKNYNRFIEFVNKLMKSRVPFKDLEDDLKRVQFNFIKNVDLEFKENVLGYLMIFYRREVSTKLLSKDHSKAFVYMNRELLGKQSTRLEENADQLFELTQSFKDIESVSGIFDPMHYDADLKLGRVKSAQDIIDEFMSKHGKKFIVTYYEKSIDFGALTKDDTIKAIENAKLKYSSGYRNMSQEQLDEFYSTLFTDWFNSIHESTDYLDKLKNSYISVGEMIKEDMDIVTGFMAGSNLGEAWDKHAETNTSHSQAIRKQFEELKSATQTLLTKYSNLSSQIGNDVKESASYIRSSSDTLNKICNRVIKFKKSNGI